MSSRSAKHRKPSSPARARPRAQHRKPSPIAVAIQNAPTRAVTVTGAVLIASAATPAVIHMPVSGTGSQGPGQPAALSHAGWRPDLGEPQLRGGFLHNHAHAASTRAGSGAGTASTGRHARAGVQTADHQSRTQQGRHRAPAPADYRNPLRSLSGLVAERIDQGVDFAGSGPIYAIGNGVVTQACGSCWGWPGGGWITYRLTSGPAAGLTVYVAEDVRPTVSVGEQVNSGTVVASMYAGGDGIETGWAMADSSSAESQLPEAGGIAGPGPFPTKVGANFDELLQVLGVPAATNSGQYSYGLLPEQYPSDWAAALLSGR